MKFKENKLIGGGEPLITMVLARFMVAIKQIKSWIVSVQ